MNADNPYLNEPHCTCDCGCAAYLTDEEAHTGMLCWECGSIGHDV